MALKLIGLNQAAQVVKKKREVGYERGLTALSLVGGGGGGGGREDSPCILCRGECILRHYEARFISLLLMPMVLVCY